MELADVVAFACALALAFSRAGVVFGIVGWIAFGVNKRGSDRLTRSLVDRVPSILGRIGVAALVALRLTSRRRSKPAAPNRNRSSRTV
jgi:hypothetical protein